MINGTYEEAGMDKRLEALVANTFRLKEVEGPDKVTSLSDAIKRNIKPGMLLHIGIDANAAICELIRQYWGTNPGFTYISSMVINHGLNLIHAGLINKVITSNSSDIYPTPSPSRIVQRAYKAKTVKFENWSLYSHLQRLMAGALGLEFLPTRSLIGSSMAEENKESFQMLEDPFGSGKKLGIVKALIPDISMVHALAADRYGNAIPVPPYIAETAWGVKASRYGAILTTEKLVSTDFIRKHSLLVKIPGYMVNAVAITPFGAHPGGLINRGLPEVEPYGDDDDFIGEYRKATEAPPILDSWLKEWVLNCPTHEDYLTQLGHHRLMLLKGKAQEDVWQYELNALADNISLDLEYNSAEMMVVAAARLMQDKILKNNYKTMLTGVGVSALAGWLASYQLKKRGYDIELVIGSGAFGHSPRPANVGLNNYCNIMTCKIITDTQDVYGVIVGGVKSSCLGALGAGQIDKWGNINSTKLSDDLFLVGAGGGNDVVSGAREVVVVAHQSSRRFVEKVPYISMPGERVTTLVSTLGVMEKIGHNKEFTLTHYLSTPESLTQEQRIKKISENCGWELKMSASLKEIPPPTMDELTILRLLDPKREYLAP
jgi:acyl CoA:acetate/3-ketoacid CoA transferase alpha subunit/acyl CoA:acetate/3-ketoacid CoA transferase beta subunit